MIVAGVVGYICIRVMMYVVSNKKLAQAASLALAESPGEDVYKRQGLQMWECDF